VYIFACVCVRATLGPRIIILYYTRVLYTRDRIMLCRKPDAEKYFNIRFRARCVVYGVRAVAAADTLSRWPPRARCIIHYTPEIYALLRNDLYDHSKNVSTTTRCYDIDVLYIQDEHVLIWYYTLWYDVIYKL